LTTVAPAAPDVASDGLIEIVMTLDVEQFGEMGMDLEDARSALGLPKSASKTEVIRRAVRFAAGSK
jgi:hypothetical protein